MGGMQSISEEQALWYAASRGNAPALEAALGQLTPATRTAQLEWADGRKRRTPLARACAKGHVACARLLIDAGADVNATDKHGNTPLHAACKRGHHELVALLAAHPTVRPCEVNMDAMTPLDLLRHRHAQIDRHDDHHRRRAFGYERCIEEVEKRLYVHSGVLFEKSGNFLTQLTGMSELSLWKLRLCIVLERGIPGTLELALFRHLPGKPRPARPSTVILCQVRHGIMDVEDSSWLEQKPHAFALQGSIRRDDQRGGMHMHTPPQRLEFAGTDAPGLEMWRAFFTSQQDRFNTAVDGQPPAAAWYASIPYAVAAPEQFAPSAPDFRPSSPGVSPAAAYAASAVAPVTTPAPPPPPAIHDSKAPAPAILRTTVSAVSTATSTGAMATATSAATMEASSMTLFPSATAAPNAQGECIVCFDGPQAVVAVPCGHNAICGRCADVIQRGSRDCPVCRKPVREFVTLYRV